MSNTTEQTTYHYMLTVQKPTRQGLAVNTAHGTCTPLEGATRQRIYEDVRAEHDRVNPELEGGTVLFWSLESNQL